MAFGLKVIQVQLADLVSGEHPEEVQAGGMATRGEWGQE